MIIEITEKYQMLYKRVSIQIKLKLEVVQLQQKKLISQKIKQKIQNTPGCNQSSFENLRG